MQAWAHHWGGGAPQSFTRDLFDWWYPHKQTPNGDIAVLTTTLNKAHLELTWPFLCICHLSHPSLGCCSWAAQFTTWRELLGSHRARLTVGEWYFKGTDAESFFLNVHTVSNFVRATSVWYCKLHVSSCLRSCKQGYFRGYSEGSSTSRLKISVSHMPDPADCFVSALAIGQGLGTFRHAR